MLEEYAKTRCSMQRNTIELGESLENEGTYVNLLKKMIHWFQEVKETRCDTMQTKGGMHTFLNDK